MQINGPQSQKGSQASSGSNLPEVVTEPSDALTKPN